MSTALNDFIAEYLFKGPLNRLEFYKIIHLSVCMIYSKANKIANAVIP